MVHIKNGMIMEASQSLVNFYQVTLMVNGSGGLIMSSWIQLKLSLMDY